MARVVHVEVQPNGDWYLTVLGAGGREVGSLAFDDDHLQLLNQVRLARPTPQTTSWDVPLPPTLVGRKVWWRRLLRFVGFRALLDPAEFVDEAE